MNHNNILAYKLFFNYKLNNLVVKILILFGKYRLECRYTFCLLFCIYVGWYISLESFENISSIFLIICISLLFLNTFFFASEFYKCHYYRTDRNINLLKHMIVYLIMFIITFLSNILIIYCMFTLEKNYLWLIFFCSISLTFNRLLSKKKFIICNFHGLSKIVSKLKRRNYIFDLYFSFELLDCDSTYKINNLLNNNFHIWMADGNPNYRAQSLNQDILEGLYQSKMILVFISKLYLFSHRLFYTIIELNNLNINFEKRVLILHTDEISKYEILKIHPTLQNANFFQINIDKILKDKDSNIQFSKLVLKQLILSEEDLFI